MTLHSSVSAALPTACSAWRRDPGARSGLYFPGGSKQLFGAFVCLKKVLLRSVEAKHPPNTPRVLCKMVPSLCWSLDTALASNQLPFKLSHL